MGNAGAAGTLFLVCTGIWAITGAGGSFWPKWVLVFMLVSVARGVRRDVRRGRTAAVAAAGAEAAGTHTATSTGTATASTSTRARPDAYCLTKRTRDGSNANVIRCSSG